MQSERSSFMFLVLTRNVLSPKLINNIMHKVTIQIIRFNTAAKRTFQIPHTFP